MITTAKCLNRAIFINVQIIELLQKVNYKEKFKSWYKRHKPT